MQTMQQSTVCAADGFSSTRNLQLTTALNTSDNRGMSETILALDLDPIKFKLMNAEDGEGWTRATAEAVDREYRRFLQLCLEYHGARIVPTKDVDTFWHYHILDTMKYLDDCNRVFGRFLHHFPYFGLRGENDAQELRKAAADTRLLYRTTFGGDAPRPQSAESPAGCGSVVCEVGECHMVQFSRPGLQVEISKPS